MKFFTACLILICSHSSFAQKVQQFEVNGKKYLVASGIYHGPTLKSEIINAEKSFEYLGIKNWKIPNEMEANLINNAIKSNQIDKIDDYWGAWETDYFISKSEKWFLGTMKVPAYKSMHTGTCQGFVVTKNFPVIIKTVRANLSGSIYYSNALTEQIIISDDENSINSTQYVEYGLNSTERDDNFVHEIVLFHEYIATSEIAMKERKEEELLKQKEEEEKKKQKKVESQLVESLLINSSSTPPNQGVFKGLDWGCTISDIKSKVSLTKIEDGEYSNNEWTTTSTLLGYKGEIDFNFNDEDELVKITCRYDKPEISYTSIYKKMGKVYSNKRAVAGDKTMVVSLIHTVKYQGIQIKTIKEEDNNNTIEEFTVILLPPEYKTQEEIDNIYRIKEKDEPKKI